MTSKLPPLPPGSPDAAALAPAYPLLAAVQTRDRIARRGRIDQAVLGAGRILERMRQIGALDDLAYLPARFFDARQQGRFEVLSQALLYLDRQVGRASRSPSPAPPALIEEADALRARLQRWLEYHFHAGDPGLRRELAYLRRRRGHLGRVEALLGLADLCDEHRDELEGYPPPHDPEDGARARDLAHALRAHLRALPNHEIRDLKELRDRAWSAWVACWDDLVRALRFVLGRRPEAAELKTAVTLGRRPARRPKATESHGAEQGVAPGPPTARGADADLPKTGPARPPDATPQCRLSAPSPTSGDAPPPAAAPRAPRPRGAPGGPSP